VKLRGAFEIELSDPDEQDYSDCAQRFSVEIDEEPPLERLLAGYVRNGVLTEEEARKVRDNPGLGEAVKRMFVANVVLRAARFNEQSEFDSALEPLRVPVVH